MLISCCYWKAQPSEVSNRQAAHAVLNMPHLLGLVRWHVLGGHAGDDAGPAGLWTWNELRQTVRSDVPKVSLAGISEDFYLWFWSLSYGHLHFPAML